MATSLVYSLLGSYLKLVLKDFQKEQFQLSVGKGEVVLRDMQLNEKVLQYMMHFPPVLQVQKASCKIFKIIVPWRHLKQEPVTVILEDISISVAEVATPAWQYTTLPLIDNLVNMVLMGGVGLPMRDTLVQRLFEDITVQLLRTNVSLHFLAQDRMNPGPAASVSLDSVIFRTTDSKGKVVPLSQARAEGASKTTIRIFKELYLGNTVVRLHVGDDDLDVITTQPVSAQIVSYRDVEQSSANRVLFNMHVPDVPVRWNDITWPGFLETATAAIWCFREGYSFAAPPPPNETNPQQQQQQPQQQQQQQKQQASQSRDTTPRGSNHSSSVRTSSPVKESNSDSWRKRSTSSASSETEYSQFDYDDDDDDYQEFDDYSFKSRLGGSMEMSDMSSSKLKTSAQANPPKAKLVRNSSAPQHQLPRSSSAVEKPLSQKQPMGSEPSKPAPSVGKDGERNPQRGQLVRSGSIPTSQFSSSPSSPSPSPSPSSSSSSLLPEKKVQQKQPTSSDASNPKLSAAIEAIASAQWPHICVSFTIDQASIEYDNLFRFVVNDVEVEIQSENLPPEVTNKLPRNSRPIDRFQFVLKVLVPLASVECMIPGQKGLKVLTVKRSSFLDSSVTLRPSLLPQEMTLSCKLPYLEGLVVLGCLELQVSYELFEKAYDVLTCFYPSREFHGVSMSNLELLIWWLDRCSLKVMSNGVTLAVVNPKQSVPACIMASVTSVSLDIEPSRHLLTNFTNKQFKCLPDLGPGYSYVEEKPTPKEEENHENQNRKVKHKNSFFSLWNKTEVVDGYSAEKDCFFFGYGSLIFSDLSLTIKQTESLHKDSKTQDSSNTSLRAHSVTVNFEVFRPAAFVRCLLEFLTLEKRQHYLPPDTMPAFCAHVFVPVITSNIEQTSLLRIWPLLLDYTKWGRKQSEVILERVSKSPMLDPMLGLLEDNIGTTMPVRGYATVHVGKSDFSLTASEKSCRSLVSLLQQFQLSRNITEDFERFEQLLSHALVDDFSDEDIVPLLRASFDSADVSLLRSLLLVQKTCDQKALFSEPTSKMIRVFYDVNARLSKIVLNFIPNKSFPLCVEVVPLSHRTRLPKVFPALREEDFGLDEIHPQDRAELLLSARLFMGDSVEEMYPVVKLLARNYLMSSQGNPLPLIQATASMIKNWNHFKGDEEKVDPSGDSSSSEIDKNESVTENDSKASPNENEGALGHMLQIAQKLTNSEVVDTEIVLKQMLNFFGALVSLDLSDFQICHSSNAHFDFDKAATGKVEAAVPPLTPTFATTPSLTGSDICPSSEADAVFPSFNVNVAPSSSSFALATVRDVYDASLDRVKEDLVEIVKAKEQFSAQTAARCAKYQEQWQAEDAERVKLEEELQKEYVRLCDLQKDVAVCKHRIDRADELSKALNLIHDGKSPTAFLKQCSQKLSAACIPGPSKPQCKLDEQIDADMALIWQYEQETEKIKEEMIAELVKLQDEYAENERLLEAAREKGSMYRIPLIENVVSESAAHVSVLESLVHCRYEAAPVDTSSSSSLLRPRHFLSDADDQQQDDTSKIV